jgi:outer membrane receptor for ferrienterochelin and colicins
MNKIYILSTVLLLFFSAITCAQKTKTDANVIGHVVCCGNHIPFATVGVKGTTIGTVTDETGHYQLINIPTGDQTIFVSIVGYKPQEHKIKMEAGKTVELKFELEEDVLSIDEVVVSADGACVRGVNFELKLKPLKNFSFNSGFTILI